MKGGSAIRRLFHRCCRLPWGRFLLYWMAVLKTGFDNRLARALFRRTLYGGGGRNSKILPTESQILFDDKVEQSGSVSVCRDVIINFDLCRLVPMSKGKGREVFFEEGFIRIGGRISPPSKGYPPMHDLERWRHTDEPSPAAREFAPGKTALFIQRINVNNVALAMRCIDYHLQILEQAGMSIGDEVLLWPANRQLQGKILALVTDLFDVKEFKEGTFLFRKMVFDSGRLPGMARSEAIASLRHHLLTAFGIEPRSRVSGVSSITLISRQDWKDPSFSNGVRSIARKISNEDEIIAALRKRFPDSEVKKASLERLSMKEQLSLVHHTDVLVAMHGAALGFCRVLPPNAGLLELFPAYFMYPHWITTFYQVMANNRGHYQRWINLNPGREFSSDVYTYGFATGRVSGFAPRRDFTEVPPSAVVRKVEVLQRQIRKMAH